MHGPTLTFLIDFYQIIFQLSSDKMRAVLYTSTSTIDLSHTKILATGLWYFIHVSIDMDNNLLGIQINNTTAETKAITGNLNGTASVLTVGSFNSAAYLNGRIWELCKWNRILTALELSNLYNGGNGLFYPFS